MAKKARCRGKGTGTLVLRGKTWCARWMVNGKVFTRTTGTSDRRQAEAKLSEFVAPFMLGGEAKTLETVAARLGGVKAELARYEDEKPAIAIRHGWQAYLDQHNRPDTGETTLEVYEGQYEAFASWMEGSFSQIEELRHVTQDHADRYAGHLLKRVGASTFNRHVVLLTLVWRVLEKAARLSFNPWKQIARKRFVVHSRRELTIAEINAVMNTAAGEMRVLLALGLYCGLRLGDAACMGWGNVDMVKRVVSLVPAKTKRRRKEPLKVPLHPTLYAMLAETPERSRRGRVLPGLAERYESNDGALAKDVGRLFGACGIATKNKDAGAKRASADCGYHSLRHSFVSLCAAGGVSQSIVQSLVGHGSPAMTQHYSHIGLETARTAIATLPGLDGVNTKALPADAAGANLDTVLAMLDGLSAEALAEVAKKAHEIADKRRTA